jgi:hypothetical protein
MVRRMPNSVKRQQDVEAHSEASKRSLGALSYKSNCAAAYE